MENTNKGAITSNLVRLRWPHDDGIVFACVQSCVQICVQQSEKQNKTGHIQQPGRELFICNGLDMCYYIIKSDN